MKTKLTGFKATNGKEIREADILSNGNFRCKVEWHYGQWRWVSKENSDSLYIYLLVNKQRKIKIIGNIYENEDLLNGPDQPTPPSTP